MCGIAGVIVPAGSAGTLRPREIVEQMTARLHHRGPDGCGAWHGAGARHHLSLGHTRLAILDPTAAAGQPMLDPASGCVLIYNGEVYNFAALRAELEQLGDTFRSSGDTEVVLKACVRWGSNALRRFRGMFALAFFDPRHETLLLARDPFGMKPLYFTEDWSGCFAFSSEVRPLLGLPWSRRRLDPVGLLGYLSYGSAQEPFTLVSGVQSLLPAHALTLNLARGNLAVNEPQRYWEMPVRRVRTAAAHPDGDAVHLRRTLAESVRLHMVSDAPVAAFLSGGLDSTAIAALMAEAAGVRVRGLTVSFEGAGFDECPLARQVARAYGIEHTEVRLTAGELAETWETWLSAQDQPGSDGANTWIISRACARAGVRVALSGLGADELFGGYSTFPRTLAARRWARPLFSLPGFLRAPLASLLGALPSMGARKIADWLQTDGSLLSSYLCLRRVMPSGALRRLLHPVAFNMSSADLHCGVWNSLLRSSGDCDPLSAVSLLEAGSYMVSTLLRDSDQMGMAHSLEIRMPFVDRAVAEAALGIPGAAHTLHGPKTLLRAAMRDKLRPAWIGRPKEGFTVPFDRLLRGVLRPRVESALSSTAAFPFRAGATRRLWHSFLRGNGSVSGAQVLTLASLARWLERHGVGVED
ncbi:MAG TPA: asparagine synthase (glutamine-hydrolyzing) [Bryobacteraceae bacterium]|nr:asparagine synthase (glutamine-hydrolyzing) [Bryobacteraceae bacterium]